MKNAPDKLQWHPAFCAAAGLEFHEDIERLELKPEYNLSKEPIRIDLLIIKDRECDQIKNEIGHIMRTYNVIEYKSPEDALTIDDFYKTVGYACLYKGYGEYVDAVPINELTVSIFRATRPEKMFLTLQKYGHKHRRKISGNLLCDRTSAVSSADYCDTGIRAGRASEFEDFVKSCKERRCGRIPEKSRRNEYIA